MYMSFNSSNRFIIQIYSFTASNVIRLNEKDKVTGLGLSQWCQRIPQKFIVKCQQNGQKGMSVHPFRLFAIYRSVKLCANTNFKVTIQQLWKNCNIQNVDLNSWNKFVQTCLQSKKFFILPNFKCDFCECQRTTFFDIIRFNEHGKIDANCKSVFIGSFFGYLFIKMK